MADNLKVVDLYPSNYRDISATLRLIADSIESGEYGDVSSAAVVLKADEVEIFGMGPEESKPATHMLFCAAASKLLEVM